MNTMAVLENLIDAGIPAELVRSDGTAIYTRTLTDKEARDAQRIIDAGGEEDKAQRLKSDALKRAAKHNGKSAAQLDANATAEIVMALAAQRGWTRTNGGGGQVLAMPDAG